MAPRNDDGEEGNANARISISIDPSIRRKVRLAAAIADMSVGEWCTQILERAADKAVPELPRIKSA